MFIDFSSIATSIGIGGLAYLYRDRRIFGILDGICYKENIKNNHRCRRIIGRYHAVAIQRTNCAKLGKVEAALGNAMTNFNGFSLNTPFLSLSDQILDAISNSGFH